MHAHIAASLAYLSLVAAITHAQTAPPSSAAPAAVAAVSGELGQLGTGDLKQFVSAYIVGFVASALWLGFFTFRSLRANARSLRGAR
jgi:hypothetical protein